MKRHMIVPLFKKFIKDTETGKRLKKNGERIKPQSIQNYYYVMQNLIQFSIETKFELMRVLDFQALAIIDEQFHVAL